MSDKTLMNFWEVRILLWSFILVEVVGQDIENEGNMMKEGLWELLKKNLQTERKVDSFPDIAQVEQSA